MSRCFPFPPPGYIRNGARSDALIESIKLQREMEKAKKDRKKEKKEKKKEKEERRKEKKERKLKEGTTSHHGDSKKFKHIDELKDIKADGKLLKADGKLLKGEDFENEQLERSGITEEHDQPVSSRDPCCLSDSTESSKRKRSSTSPSTSHDHGTAIRIRLPLRKNREPEQAKPVQLGSSNSLIQVTGSSVDQLQRVPNAEGNQSIGNSDSRHCKTSLNSIHGDALVTNSTHDVEGQRMESLYNSLLQIPLTGEGLDSDDQDWLFSSDLTEAKRVSKKVKSVTDAVRCSTPSLWPHAQYLHEVDMYALPYTVPF